MSSSCALEVHWAPRIQRRAGEKSRRAHAESTVVGHAFPSSFGGPNPTLASPTPRPVEERNPSLNPKLSQGSRVPRISQPRRAPTGPRPQHHGILLQDLPAPSVQVLLLFCAFCLSFSHVERRGRESDTMDADLRSGGNPAPMGIPHEVN